jgi:hypothetical protein
MNAFWRHPTTAEARAWGSYPYDSDPVSPPSARSPGP